MEANFFGFDLDNSNYFTNECRKIRFQIIDNYIKKENKSLNQARNLFNYKQRHFFIEYMYKIKNYKCFKFEYDTYIAERRIKSYEVRKIKLDNKICSYCKTKDNLERHHINENKIILLCRYCHLNIAHSRNFKNSINKSKSLYTD
jgi:DNA modification methylase